MKLRAG